MASRLKKEPIKVFLRARPLNKFEETSGCSAAVKFIEKTRVSIRDHCAGDFQSELDSVFDLTSDQEVIYQGVCANVPQQLLDGFDCAIFAYGATGTGKTYSILGGETTDKETDERLAQAEEGIIPRLARGIFNLIKSSDPAVEYTVRCSVVEIYLDRLRDLLVDSCHVRVAEGKLRGCSRLSCLSADDIINIVYRAHAARTSSTIDSCRESSRSSMIIQLEIEQYDSRSQSVKGSTLLICDLVGSELSNVPTGGTGHGTSDFIVERIPEKSIVSKSLNVLKRLAEERKNGVPVTMPLTAPPLAQLLSPYLGGLSHTSILLTGSISDIASKETIETLKFGEICRSIQNAPTLNVHERWQDCSMGLMEARENNHRFENLVKVLANECHRLQSKSGSRFSSTTLENVISEIIEATSEHRDIKFSIETKAEHQIRTEQMKLKSETRRAVQTRDELLSAHAQMKTDLQILKDQNIRLLEGKENAEAELASLKNEILVAHAEKIEAEHNLRTSQFRENEAVVFLRQFRRFYFRLRKKMAVYGSGNISQIAQQIPGAPGLDNLVDIDNLMVESGLLEEHEIGGDISPHPKTSPEAMTRSSSGATKMKDAVNENSNLVQSDEVLDGIIPITKSAVIRENPQVIEARQRLCRTPAGKYLEMRENDLEVELMSLSEKASELEKALAEEKEKVETLTKSTGVAAALERLKNMKETKLVKDQLEKKEHDLNAVIWKMNEMHMTGKSLQAMLSERDSRIVYLEKGFNEATNQNLSLVMEKEQGDRSLHDEIATLATRIRRFSEPIRYFGEPSTADIPLQCRLVAPFAPSRDSGADIKVIRRASIGEAGEWITATYSTEKANVQTQTIIERNDGQTQTEIKQAKDCEAQTDFRVQNVDGLVDAETQTDALVGTHVAGGFDESDAGTQTEGVLLTLKDIELSTIEAAASAVPEANVDDLLFLVTSREESLENIKKHSAQRELHQIVAIRKDDVATDSMFANAFLFMEDESVEDAHDETKSLAKNIFESDSDAAEKGSSGIIGSGNRTRGSFALSMISNQVANKGPPGTSGSHHSHFSGTSVTEDDSVTMSLKTTNEIVAKHSGEGSKTPEKLGTPEPTLNEGKNLLVEVVPEETKPNKPISSFLAKLQAQARKKEAAQASETIDEVTVPEFMKKFRTIGARNANESVIETSGESTGLLGESSRQLSYGGTRFVDASSSIPWHPRKKNNEDDDSEGNESCPAIEEEKTPSNHDNSGSHLLTNATEINEDAEEGANGIYSAPNRKSSTVESRSSSAEEVVRESPMIARAPDVDERSGAGSESGPSSSSKPDDDSDSSSADENEKTKPAAQVPEAGLPSSSKADDDSESSSNDEENKPAAQVPKSGLSSSSKADDDSDSSSDDEDEEKKPKRGLSSSLKADDEDEKSRQGPQIPTSVLPSSLKADDDSSSSSDDEKGRQTAVPTSGLSSSLKADDDSDSSSDDEDEKSKPAAQAPPSGLSSSSEADDLIDSSSDDEDEKSDTSSDEDNDEQSRSAVAARKAGSSSSEVVSETDPSGTPTAVPRADSSSDDNTSGNDDDNKPVEEKKPVVPSKASAGSLLIDDSSGSSSDEGEEESVVVQVSKKGSAALKANDIPIPRAPTQRARKEPDASENSSSSDASELLSEDESTNKDSKKMLQGGKSTDFKPKRKVTDFGANVSPALSPKKPVKTKGKRERESKGKADASAKLVTKGDKLVKGRTNREQSKSSAKSATDTKSSKFAVRGSDIVLADEGEWGKSASKKSVKGKSSFVIKNGKLVKNETSPPPPSKSEKPAFKIVGGKLVKQGKGDGGTKKAAGKSGKSKMGEI